MVFFLEVYPGDELFMNITYNDLLKTFEVNLSPQSVTETVQRIYEFELDTDDDYAILARASVYGTMSVTFAGFIPLGE